jgi:ABC-type transporter Mla MlaB component
MKMYELKINRKDKKAKLILTGPLVLAYAVKIKEAFSELQKEGNDLIVNHEKAEEFDLSYLQLLLSLNRSAAAEKKKLTVEGSNHEAFVSLTAGLNIMDWVKSESLNVSEGA